MTDRFQSLKNPDAERGVVRKDTSSVDFLSVIMPAYNEGVKIFNNIIEAHRSLTDLNIPFEIIVVDDGSTDDTDSEIQRASSIFSNVKVVCCDSNNGKGNALKTGWKYCKGNLITFIDADLELHPSQLVTFLTIMKETGADIVIGSKRHPDSIVDYPKKRKFLSRSYNLLIRLIFGMKITDTQPGMKLFKSRVLDVEFPKQLVKRYAFDLELLVNSWDDGFKIVEAPLNLKFSRKNGGRIGVEDIVHIFKDTTGIFFRSRIAHTYSHLNK